MSHPAMSSASSVAFLIEETVLSMLITTPFRSPFEGWDPIPTISIPSSVTAPTMAQIFVVPMSRPTIKSSFFAIRFSPFPKMLFMLSTLPQFDADHASQYTEFVVLVDRSHLENDRVVPFAFPNHNDQAIQTLAASLS